MDLSLLSQHERTLELLPTALDRKAQEHPNEPWACVPLDADDLSKGTLDISWYNAANAYNRAAWILERTIGKAQFNAFPTVTYYGPSDLRYFFITVALMKLGYKALLLQTTLSLEGKLNLLEKTECVWTVYCDDQSLIDDLLQCRNLRAFKAPGIDELMAATPVEPYPYDRNLEEGLFDPTIVLHTSGSTCLPKPVIINQGFQAVNRLDLEVPDLDGKPSIWKMAKMSQRFYVGFPIAHAGGISLFLNLSAYCEDVIPVVVEKNNLSGDTLKATIEHAGVRGALVMPRALIELAQDKAFLPKLRNMLLLSFSGGPLPVEVGEELSKHAPLVSSWGSTESGADNLHIPDQEDWSYNYINPEYNYLRWRDVGDEVIAVQHPDPIKRHHQKIFWIYPDHKEWPYGDLWSKHPTKPNLYRFEGRLDDMITLDSGHNFHPMFYVQEILLKDPHIKSAIILGSDRPDLAVLIQPTERTFGSHEASPEDFWDVVQKVNERSNKQAQMPRDNIVLAKPDRPLPVGSKGQVIRKQAEGLYTKELEKVWSA